MALFLLNAKGVLDCNISIVVQSDSAKSVRVLYLN